MSFVWNFKFNRLIIIFNLKKEKDKNNNEKINKEIEKKEKNKDKFVKNIKIKWR